MIEIEPYKAVGGIAFNSSIDDALAHFGPPLKRLRNPDNHDELHYKDFIARFDNGLREFTLLPRAEARIDGLSVSWDKSFVDDLLRLDGEIQEVCGCLVSLKLGIAMTGIHDQDEPQMAIHAFRLGDWDVLKDDMQPYHRE